MPNQTRPATRPPERRKAKRYAIGLNAHFALQSRRGKLVGDGRTVNISSFGLLFESPMDVSPGDYIDLTLEWPVSRPNGEELCLTLSGYVVRARSPLIAVCISRYDLLAVEQIRAASEDPTKPVVAPMRKRRPKSAHGQTARQPSIVIIEDPETYHQFATLLARFGFSILPAEAAEAKNLMQVARSACLIVTNTLTPFLGAPAPAPIIYTGPETAGGVPPELAADVVVVQKPFTYGQLVKTASDLLRS